MASETLLRLILVITVLVAAGIVAYLTRLRIPHHPPVMIAGLGLPSGIVVFTSTECQRCKEALATAKSLGAPVREVTYELEPDLQGQVGVVAVPLTLVINPSGEQVAQLAGRPRRGALRRAVQRAGL